MDRLNQRTQILELVTTLRYAKQIALVHDALDVIEIVPIYRDPGMTCRQNELHEVLYRRVKIGSHDLRTWRHHFPGHFIAEVDNGLDHLACILLKNSFFLSCIDERLDLFLRSLLFLLRRFDIFFPPSEIIQS